MKDFFSQYNVTEQNRLYIIGNGFDIHHSISTRYSDFMTWIQKNKDSRIIELMDTFFSEERSFWSEIEIALGEYDEKNITEYCEPENEEEFKYDHPGQWQAGIEDSIPYIFGEAMRKFRETFDDWVESINVNEIEIDFFLSKTSKYLTLNYTETLEKCYGIPLHNVLHIHGSRLDNEKKYIIGHNNHRDINEPMQDEDILFPYQNAYSSVIETMNGWIKNPQQRILLNKSFFSELKDIKGVCVIGYSYNEIDMPYLKEILSVISPDSCWVLGYHNDEDKKKAEITAKSLKLSKFDFCYLE